MNNAVLITGAASGIGLATVKKFLSEGWTVIGTSRNGKIPGVKSENLHVVKIDLATSASIKKAAEEVKKKFKKIDVLINNAGIMFGNGDTVKVDTLRKILEVNLFGLIDFAEKIVPLIKKGGRVLNTSSGMSSLQEYKGTYASEYQISKTALNKYTRVLAQRLRGKGIKVASVDPGWVRTKMGGMDAYRAPGEPAAEFYHLATSDFETGEFYHANKKRPW